MPLPDCVAPDEAGPLMRRGRVRRPLMGWFSRWQPLVRLLLILLGGPTRRAWERGSGVGVSNSLTLHTPLLSSVGLLSIGPTAAPSAPSASSLFRNPAVADEHLAALYLCAR